MSPNINELLTIVKLEHNNRPYSLKVYTNDCSVYPWKAFLYDDLNRSIGMNQSKPLNSLQSEQESNK